MVELVHTHRGDQSLGRQQGIEIAPDGRTELVRALVRTLLEITDDTLPFSRSRKEKDAHNHREGHQQGRHEACPAGSPDTLRRADQCPREWSCDKDAERIPSHQVNQLIP